MKVRQHEPNGQRPELGQVPFAGGEKVSVGRATRRRGQRAKVSFRIAPCRAARKQRDFPCDYSIELRVQIEGITTVVFHDSSSPHIFLFPYIR